MSIPTELQCLHCEKQSADNGNALYCFEHMTDEYRKVRGYSKQGEGFAKFLILFGILTLPAGIGIVFIIMGLMGLQKKY